MSRKNKTIAVSGTNGKSTTTAILGLILEKAGLDPTVIVGSKVSLWNSNLRVGLSNLLVLEACEHQANMLKIDPQLVVLTNLEKDHLDYYHDLKHIINTFQEYVNKLPSSGVLCINMDDQNLKKLKTKAKIVTYGIKSQAEVMAKHIRPQAGGQEFELVDARGKSAQSIKIILTIPGQFNIANVLAAAAVALHLGVDLKTIKQTVEKFTGIWRRFEKVGQYQKAVVISDYAHHPTAVQGTIQAAREFYPGQKIMAVFQPHHHNRTKKLFNEFVQSFFQADLIIISEIYDVVGREQGQDQDVSSQDLVREINQRLGEEKAFYAKDLKQTQHLILEKINQNDIVLIMGAGDIDDLARELVSLK